MGAITIRRIDDKIIAALKTQAQAAGRSMEEEARRILEAATSESAAAIDQAARIAHVEGLRRMRAELFGDRILPSSLDLLREIRNEDPTVSPEDVGEP
jgi:plasmid stability protein